MRHISVCVRAFVNPKSYLFLFLEGVVEGGEQEEGKYLQLQHSATLIVRILRQQLRIQLIYTTTIQIYANLMERKRYM